VRPVQAERRQLSVLFCDLIPSTELAAQLDPEDVREVIRAYQAAGAASVCRLDGHCASFLGDGILAYFGWPRAHEDHAERAVRAGRELVEDVARLQIRAGVPLQARVGIATGHAGGRPTSRRVVVHWRSFRASRRNWEVAVRRRASRLYGDLLAALKSCVGRGMFPSSDRGRPGQAGETLGVVCGS
jgi:class 3 adenylate cyclase